MKANNYIKSLLIALALIFGTQTAQASVFETFVKPIVDNKIATIMSITSAILGYVCYCLIRKLNDEEHKRIGDETLNLLVLSNIREENDSLQKELNTATSLLEEIYKNYQDMMRYKSEELNETFLNEHSGIDGLNHRDLMNAYLNHQRISRVTPEN